MNQLVIDPLGTSLTVNVVSDPMLAFTTDAAGLTPATWPRTVATPTTFYAVQTGTVLVSMKAAAGGLEVATPAGTPAGIPAKATVSGTVTVSPGCVSGFLVDGSLSTILMRRQSAAAWASANPVLALGEHGYETDTGIERIGNGTTAFIDLSSGIRTVKQTAQITNNAVAAFTDITGLLFSVQANHFYRVRFEMQYESAAAGTFLMLQCGTPAQTAGQSRVEIQQAGTGTTQYFNQTTGAANFGSTATATAVAATNTPYMAILEGWIVPSAGGTLQMKARTNVDATQITVRSGHGVIHDCG